MCSVMVQAAKDTSKERLDVLLVQRGLVESRQRAQALVLAGQVTVDHRVADKPGMKVPVSAQVSVKERLPYVSRGGFKLAAALDAFGLDVQGLVAADVGVGIGPNAKRLEPFRTEPLGTWRLYFQYPGAGCGLHRHVVGCGCAFGNCFWLILTQDC